MTGVIYYKYKVGENLKPISGSGPPPTAHRVVPAPEYPGVTVIYSSDAFCIVRGEFMSLEGHPGPLRAGNTCETLAPIHLEASAIDPTEPIPNLATEATNSDASVEETVLDTDDQSDPFDAENLFDISRAEFAELQEAVIRLLGRIEKYNRGASHRI